MKKLTEKEFRQLTKPLPLRERERLKRTEMTPEWLKEQIAYSKQEMKNDLYLGIPWVIIYAVSSSFPKDSRTFRLIHNLTSAFYPPAVPNHP